MEEHDLTSPLLSPRSSDQPQTVLTIRDDEDSDQFPSIQQFSLHANTHHRSHNQSRFNNEKFTVNSPNPYDFLGSGEYSVPAPTTVDPFRNGTPFISGVYEDSVGRVER
ncbi:hypothetical protein F3Y22_tig00012523pilonHSYRG00157 [Hibiscus syriacus]|uniref:Uncharacterized protein n=1 Tax=Hibiscus syriacus TaxID=106335 RepID=A0A6A3C351_HIBSY|nr:hypothetical protein F3Y22_tig00012523pilonHSYRG00157 [Hibiscus syriacus]